MGESKAEKMEEQKWGQIVEKMIVRANHAT
jgi:hypothetical protein